MATNQDIVDLLQKIEKLLQTKNQKKTGAKTPKSPVAGLFNKNPLTAIQDFGQTIIHALQGSLPALTSLPQKIFNIFNAFTALGIGAKVATSAFAGMSRQQQALTQLMARQRVPGHIPTNNPLVVQNVNRGVPAGKIAYPSVAQQKAFLNTFGGQIPGGPQLPPPINTVATANKVFTTGKQILGNAIGKTPKQNKIAQTLAGQTSAAIGQAAAGAGHVISPAFSAAKAAPGLLASLASNPAGWVVAAIAAIVAVTAAFLALPVVALKLSDSLQDAQKKFAEFSGSLSLVYAHKDIFDIIRNQKIGNALAPSAAVLENAREKLLDRLTPYVIKIYEALNLSLGLVLDQIGMFLEKGEAIISALPDWMKTMLATLLGIFATIRKTDESGTMATWLDDVGATYGRRVREGDIAREVRIRR